MKQIGEDIYLSVEELGEIGVLKKTIWDGFFNNSPRWKSIPHPDNANFRLVRYDTLADKYKERLKARLWGGLAPGEWLAVQESVGAKQQSEGVANVLRDACETLYMKWMYDYAPVVKHTQNERLRVRQQRCLARAAAVLEGLGRYYIENGLSWRESGPVKQATEWLKEQQGRYFPLKYVPMNAVILKEKLREIWVEGREYTSVISLPRQGNNNHAEHKEDVEVRAWCIQARMSGKNLSVAEIARRVRRACELVEKAVPSVSWIDQLLRQTAIKRMCADSRWGVGSGRGDFYKGYIPTTRALYAGDCWQMDGTRVNILSHASNDKKQRFLTIVAVRDVYSGDILGVGFGLVENRWMYLDAMRMAVENAGYLPYELVHDKFPGYNTEEMGVTWDILKKLDVKRTVTAVATGKAQTERWFGTWQSVFLNREKYYYGEGVRSTRAYAHRSSEYLAKLRKEAQEEGFDFDAAWQMAWRAVCGYRNTPIKHYSKKQIDATPMELHEQCEKPHVKVLERWELARVFWPQTTLQIRRNMVTLTVQKQEYMYAVPQVLLNQESLTIRYNQKDLSTVVAFYEGGVVLAGELKQLNPVNVYGPDADWGAYQKINSANKEYVLAQQEALRMELEGSRELEGVLGEDIMLMGARVRKDEMAGAEDTLLFEQMAVVSEVLKGGQSTVGSPQSTTKGPKKMQETTKIDTKSFVLDQM